MKADPSFQKLGKPMMVTGVVQDPPKNSSIQFDALFGFRFFQLSFDDNNWLNAYLGSFVVLHPGADKAKVEQQFNRVYATHARQQLAEASKNYGYESHGQLWVATGYRDAPQSLKAHKRQY
jgi:putative ABC transport system permease protein